MRENISEPSKKRSLIDANASKVGEAVCTAASGGADPTIAMGIVEHGEKYDGLIVPEAIISLSSYFTPTEMALYTKYQLGTL